MCTLNAYISSELIGVATYIYIYGAFQQEFVTSKTKFLKTLYET